ncbi:amino acid ABC transporter substrate-binding protein [Methylobacterium sp. J-026]|nr:amino acid ABC transporter substrate-binding protein [Methylobacterium sp. J-026]MCJ2136391.1 amino acid ABC transporter substrate-binding protein [Methylobacterium sp. J-026]
MPVSADELTGTLKKVKETGRISLGFRDASVPFSFLDADQKPIGYAMDICHVIVDAVKEKLGMPGLEVRLTGVTSATRIPLIANGTIDLECGSTTNTAERHNQVAFTNTDFLTATRYVSKRSAGLRTIEDLKGKTVVSTSGTINLKQINEANTARKLGLTILPAVDHAEAFLMVQTGRAAAFVMDDVLLAALVAGSRDPSSFEISTEALSHPEPYGIMLRKDDPAFKAVANAATTKLYAGPGGRALYDRWFTQPIPPRGINLNLPMSEVLQNAYAHPNDSFDPSAY